MSRRPGLLSCLCALSLSLAGCGDGSDATTTTSGTDAATDPATGGTADSSSGAATETSTSEAPTTSTTTTTTTMTTGELKLGDIIVNVTYDGAQVGTLVLVGVVLPGVGLLGLLGLLVGLGLIVRLVGVGPLGGHEREARSCVQCGDDAIDRGEGRVRVRVVEQGAQQRPADTRCTRERRQRDLVVSRKGSQMRDHTSRRALVDPLEACACDVGKIEVEAQ